MQERSQRHDPTPQTAAQAVAPADSTPASGQVNHGLGAVPPVGEGATQADRTASQLAYEEDGNTVELKGKVGGLVEKKFGGDFKKAFDHYDANHDGAIDRTELLKLLQDAGVGNGLTRGAWASGIIEKLDTSGDAKIEWTEFETVAAARV